MPAVSVPPDWADLPDETVARPPPVRPAHPHRRQRPRGAHRRTPARTGRPRPRSPAALLPLGGVVHAGRRVRDGGALLSRAPAPREARRVADARGGGRRLRVVHADPAARGGPPRRQHVRAAPPPPPPRGLRAVVRALPRVLRAEAVQQELRAPPRLLVRAEPPGRGLRRDVRRLADARQRLGAPRTRAGPPCASSSTWTS